MENRLGALIESFLLEKPKLIKRLLKGPLAPLSTFYSRTLTAYLLGLISEDEKNDLDIIRSIRNDFAHSHKALEFSSPTISNKISKLRVPLLVPSNIKNAGSATPRQLFIDTVSMISTFLDKRRMSLKDKRKPAKSFYIGP